MSLQTNLSQTSVKKTTLIILISLVVIMIAGAVFYWTKYYTKDSIQYEHSKSTQTPQDPLEEPFVFVGKRLSGSNADLYKGTVTLEGEYYQYYPETLGGGILFFKVDDQYKQKLPMKHGQYSTNFSFNNQSFAREMLKVNDSVFKDKSVCQLAGRAKISIKDYTVELLESTVWDHTDLINVFSSDEQQITLCPDRQ